MTIHVRGPAYEPFMSTAEAVGLERPELGVDMAREIFDEAATLLHNSLALDGLDEHDTDAVVARLCADLVAADPGAAVRTSAREATEQPDGLHDPEGVAAAYLTVAAVLRI